MTLVNPDPIWAQYRLVIADRLYCLAIDEPMRE
jgi:hypothetical protein